MRASAPALLLYLVLALRPAPAAAGEVVPEAEIQALNRAITRELNSGALGSTALGDLARLLNRLRAISWLSAIFPKDSDTFRICTLICDSSVDVATPWNTTPVEKVQFSNCLPLKLVALMTRLISETSC